MKRLIVAALVTLSLAGCGGPDSGKIIDKDHDSAYTTMICTGHPVHCTPQYHPEQWKLRVDNNGERGWVGVSKHEYDKYQVGQWYP